MKKSFLIIVMSFCVLTASAAGHVSLKGIVANPQEGASLQLLNPFDRENPVLEKVEIGKKGAYEFSYNPTAIGFFFVQYAENNRVLVVLEPNKTATMDFDGKTGKISKVVNSKEIDLLKRYQELLLSNEEKITLAKQSNDMSQVLAAESENLRSVQTFCMKNADNYAVLVILDHVPIDNNIAIYDTVLSTLLKLYPKDLYALTKNNEYQSVKKTAIGSPAPEISMPTPEGKTFTLSSMRGKVVLIDFWASWCGPCRRESPNMVNLYKTYSKYDFEILGVSLDKNHGSWVEAIAKDGLQWKQVSDLKYWQSEAGAAYGVRSIPHTVLVDKDGKIIAKGLRGVELENKIKEVLNVH